VTKNTGFESAHIPNGAAQLPPGFGQDNSHSGTATTQHHKAERTKFEINGARTSVQVFEDLVNEQILLLPFTVGHLGGIATLAYHLLFGQMKTKPHHQGQQILHPTATASFYTTWPTVKMPPLTFSDEPMKIGPILTRTHVSVPHATLASLASHWAQQFLGLNLTKQSAF
jgi:hypothetical protein